MADNKRFTELDFETNKQSLKEFMQNQSEFSDYDFDGSGLSILLDVLTYNTQYLSYYLNAAYSESFVDSARLRNSIASKVKEQGYVIRSESASTAVGDVVATPSANSVAFDSIGSIILDKGKIFNCIVDGESYEFVTLDSSTLYKQNDGSFLAKNVEIKQGRLLTYEWVVDSTIEDQKFIIPNTGIDINTLKVSVQNSSADTRIVPFEESKNFSYIDSENNAYWIFEDRDGHYRLYFGDGIQGKRLYDGNIVKISYLVTDAGKANGASTFNFTSSIQGLTDVVFNTTQKSYGGSARESITEIVSNSNRWIYAQDRAVIDADYEAIINSSSLGGIIKSVSVWGGEKNNPPEYGKVFISVNLSDGLVMTDTIRTRIKEQIVNSNNVITVKPEIVDPNYLQIISSVTVRYDTTLTTLSPADVQSQIYNYIENYFQEKIQTFKTSLILSKLIAEIHNKFSFLSSVVFDITLEKRIKAQVNNISSYSIDFSNSIVPGTMKATGFKISENLETTSEVTYSIIDDSEGTLMLIREIDGDVSTAVSDFGSIDYEQGQVNIESFSPSEITTDDGTIRFTAKPKNTDIAVERNTIIDLDESHLIVAVEKENKYS